MDFKKIQKKFTLKEITIKVNQLSDTPFFSIDNNNQWLWLYYKIIINFLFKNKDSITEDELYEFLQLDVSNLIMQYKIELNEDVMNLLVGIQQLNDVNTFDEIIAKNLLITKIKENLGTVDKKWVNISLINILFSSTMVSILLLISFYSWNEFGWWSILGLTSLGVFSISKKITKKLYIKNQVNIIENKVNIIKQMPINNDSIINQIDISIKLVNNEKVQEQLKILKNKTVNLIKIATQQNSMEMIEKDIQKMWNYSIPKLIKYQNSTSEEQNIKTIKAMESFIESLLEDFFMNHEMEMNAQQKYWLSKITAN